VIRPIDMHVAFNAIPDFAKLNSGEQASLMYKQVQAFAEARNENLQRPERVVNVPERSGAAFNPDSIPFLKTKNKNKSTELRLYAPESSSGKKSLSRFNSSGRDRIGSYFDAIA